MPDPTPPHPNPAGHLPPLPLADWEDSKVTLHLYCQVVGKVRMALAPFRNHWWHVTLYVSSRGLTTGAMPCGDGTEAVQIDLDLIDHRAEVSTSRGDRRSFSLGTSVAELYRRLFAALGSLGVDVAIRPEPYDQPFHTPFAEDHQHAAWDREAVHRYWCALVWVDAVLAEFASDFSGKATPVHLFWHSFDLAYTRFSGRRAPLEVADPVAREAYTHEVVSFGFWPGDARVRQAAFYSYTYPLPEGIGERPLAPEAASWQGEPGKLQAFLPYDAVRTADDPRRALLDFLGSAYRAGAECAGWPVAELSRRGA